MTRTVAPPNEPQRSDGPRPVSKFEFNLLCILRFIVGSFPTDQGLQLVRTPATRPDCLSRNAVELVQDTLAKASVLFLTRAGGWRNDTYLRENKPHAGPVWSRIPLHERRFHFSRPVLDFLIWLTAEKVHEAKQPWDAAPKALTAADELFFCLAFDAMRIDPELTAVLRLKDVFARNPLCWLFNPGDLVNPASTQVQLPDFQPLFGGERAVITECLQPFLTQRWIQSERAKGQIGDWNRMRQQGQAEFAALRAYLQAAEEAARCDLGMFVLRANAAILQSEMQPAFWTGGLQGSGPPRLADRLETLRASLALPRQMEILERWQQRARGVAFFDEEYAASQYWKSEWDAFDGDAVDARARVLIAQLEPLRGPMESGHANISREQPGTENPADSPG